MLKAVGSKKDLQQEAYYQYVRDIIETSELQNLKNYTHHVCTTRFQHSVNVSYYNYRLCRFLGLDERAGARAGLLHDLYFYSTDSKPSKQHLQRHPSTALHNASESFALSAVERDIILKHMFPITRELPRYKETYVIVLVDKYCAVAEHVFYRLSRVLSHRKGGKRHADSVGT